MKQYHCFRQGLSEYINVLVSEIDIGIYYVKTTQFTVNS